MKTYRVWVHADICEDFTIDAEDEDEARDLAEQEFIEQFTCVTNGQKIGFDSVNVGESWEKTA